MKIITKSWEEKKCKFERFLYYTVSCCSVTKSRLTLCNSMEAARQASLSFTISQSLLKLMYIESMMPSNHLILCQAPDRGASFSSCLQFFPASSSFPMSQLLAPGAQIIGVSASASVLPMNIQG